MRPVRLEIEGFTCFRDKQIIDFSRLGLFAIAGPTGAGKSSILDAMVFALFGTIPRVGKHGVSEFVALGQDRMSVLLDFDVSGVRYRIGRVGFRAPTRPTKVQLERLVGEEGQPLAGSVKEAGLEIERILGLNTDTFQQSVLLPQGQFSRFLKAKPLDQRVILRNLLRTGIYEELRKRASDCGKEATAGASRLRQRLDEDYAGTNAEGVAALDREVGALARQIEGDEQAIVVARSGLEDLVGRFGAWEDVRRLRARLAASDAQADEMDVEARRLADAARAAEVTPWIEAATAAARLRDDAARAADTADEAANAVGMERDVAARAVAAAETAAEPVPEMEARVSALQGVIALLPEVEGARGRVITEGDAVRRQDGQVRTQEAAARDARTRIRDADTKRNELQQQIVSLGHNPTVYEGLRDAVDLAGRVRAARLASSEATDRLNEATEANRVAREAFAGAGGDLEAATRAEKNTLEAYEAAVLARTEAERGHQAHLLREHLAPGDSCPVCAQVVGAVPPAELLPALEERRRVEAEAKAALEAARRSHQQASNVEATARERAGNAAADAEKAEGTSSRAAATLASLAASLEATGAVPAGQGPIEDRLHAALSAAKLRAEQHQKLAAARDVVDTAARTAATDLDRAVELGDVATQELTRARERASAASDAVAQLEGRIRAVTEDPDPVAEQLRLREDARRLVAAWDAAREIAKTSAERSIRLEAERDAARKEAEAAETRAAVAARRAGEQAVALGFADASAAATAAIPPTERAVREQGVAAWRTGREADGVLLTSAAKKAGADEVTRQVVDAARAGVAGVEAVLSDLRRASGEKSRELATAREKLVGAVRLDAEWRRLDADRQLYDTLARDLRTDAIEKWLLDGTFRALVDGASVRLYEMSGRYTLAYRDDEFWVIDHDNAREQRKADTLSGGETFLASLCLALQLSEQVQRASGAVRLDSLFIDEGFGTLDPETLDTVAGAIEMLGAGDRMVGIITHVPELTARLPARVQVTKGAGGSTVAVREA